MTRSAPSGLPWPDGPLPDAVRADVRARARTSALLVCAVAAVGYPAWAVLDLALEPGAADRLIAVRAAGTAVIAALLWLLWRHPVGRRAPAALAFGVLAVVQVTTAWMLTDVSHVEFYLLGSSLALHGSGVLLAVRPRWTVLLVATTWTALTLALVVDPTPLRPRLVAAVAVFLAITSLVASLAHWRRAQLAVSALISRLWLEEEQRRTRELLVQLERLSLEDPLTGVANRRRWDADLAEACARARADGGRLAVALVDVDHFKQVNDRYGHAAGDAALREVATVLREHVREGDLVARLGGDELAVLLPGADAQVAVRIAERMRARSLELRPEGFAEPGVSLSIGIAAAGGGGAVPRELLAEADAQLYLAKASRNAVRALRPAVG
ncbi:GGDEF domain-containing protein [Modestobacter italicus]|uniref:GGDEF domain-containing protein n=1 Tax=Modestobacter italicus (strain DSM 44449 / CECT 9708 / BC 501) TaxID=2732864 RepID=UPI0027DF5851|nr:GGDEF domain-containing protein [Modestobacter italicus]